MSIVIFIIAQLVKYKEKGSGYTEALYRRRIRFPKLMTDKACSALVVKSCNFYVVSCPSPASTFLYVFLLVFILYFVEMIYSTSTN